MQALDQIKTDDVDPSLLQRVPLAFARNNLVLPLRIDNGRLFAAVADDRGLLAARDLAIQWGGVILETRRSPRGVLLEAIHRLYGESGSAAEVMNDLSGEDFAAVATAFEKPQDLLELTEEAPIIRLLNALLQQAVKEKASDIHVEPYEKELHVRLRIDGILHPVLTPPKIIQEALISRVKIMANLDIAEKRLPQDGRIRLLVGGQDIDVRVSIIPTPYGERVVLRLLDRKQGLRGLHDLGFGQADREAFESLLLSTSGILLVTGPTGSGKTTTLYAALNRIYSDEKNIITIEDPVEYQLQGIGQIHVNAKLGLTFANGLRSILRQDPDIIMIGEIRDLETAEIAIQASLTGHLVLSTLHTNDAATAITRLLDMGVEPYLVASSLVAVLAQRLVRTLCPQCREAYDPYPSERAYFSTPVTSLYRGRGCPACRQSGYQGRTGIYELMTLTADIRQTISAHEDSRLIKKMAIEKGMRTLYMDGLRKAAAGETALPEVLRVIQEDDDDLSL